MSGNQSETISPTAHYTGYVWVRHGLSHPAFVSAQGRFYYHSLRPFLAASKSLGGPSLEGFLLARHRAIDLLLEQAIESGRIGQVVEIAAGLSPRGWRFIRRYGERLDYIETDLPTMAARKQRRLRRVWEGEPQPHHRVVAIDALAENGPQSLHALARRLDTGKGLAIVTEGLLNYFDRAAVVAMWGRFASVLGRFPAGLYLSDLYTAGDNRGRLANGFVRLLSAFVRGQVHLHFDDADAAARSLKQAGFADARLHRPGELLPQTDVPSANLVRVIKANR